MPWTRKQVKYLLSDVSPLSTQQKTKMKGELHADPAMGHAKKGSAELSRGGQKTAAVTESNTYDWRRRGSKSRTRH